MSDAERLAERLRELLAKTSGALPWEQDGCAINSARVPHPDYSQPISLMMIYDEGGHTEDDAALIVEAVNALPTLLARIAALEDALRFYARENCWRSCGVYMSGKSQASQAELDRGNKARLALGKGSE